jgi:cell fate (sporulation/competence/biofilm development) regulator YlbF (YheA/YmcA/DUF963 family)
MTLNGVVKQLKNYQLGTGVPSVPQTNVVSPLFPGQFNYCLDEIHLSEKYGDFVNIGEDEHFQKIQPAIRLADLDRFFHGKEHSDHHYAQFTIGTVNGGHVVSREQMPAYYEKAVAGVVDFLTDRVGLEKDRLVFTYFSGAMARDVEASRKKPGQLLKVEVEHYIPEDELSKRILFEMGFSESQVIPCNTRDNYLTTNWYVFSAPWGYRNEILYKTDDGRLLDIATIERLDTEPVIEERDGDKFVVGVKPLDRCWVIDACGLERVQLATAGGASIHELPEYAKLTKTGATLLQIESAKILHRVFTDSSWSEIKSEQRRRKLNKLTENLDPLTESEVVALLRLNAKNYQAVFSDLNAGVGKTIKEICDYRNDCRDLGKEMKLKKKELIPGVK